MSRSQGTPTGPPHRALLVGALGHTAVATCLALVRYSLPQAFDDSVGLAVLVACVLMGLLLSMTALVVARGAAAAPPGRALIVSVAMCLGGSLASSAVVLLLLRFGLDGLFNPHIPIAELLTLLLLAVGSAAFLAGDYLAGRAAFRALAGRTGG